MPSTEGFSKSVLIVEDNAVQREGLATLLNEAGYSVRKACEGNEALESLRAEKPGLILLDMLLPDSGYDGWSLLERIRHDSAWTAIPVIIITALGIASEDWAHALGAVAALKKPIDTDELLLIVKRYCR